MNTKVAIIIPVRNGKDILEMTIKSILSSVRGIQYRIVLVESESTDGTAEYCDFLASIYKHVVVLHTEKEGITKAINKGIVQTSEDEDVFLTQNDVIFPVLYNKCWLRGLHDFAYSHERVGITTCANGIGISGDDYFAGFEWVGTWCMYIPRKTINKIGVLDELFSPGPGDDIDYSYRVKMASLNVVKVDFGVDHHRSGENYNDCIEDVKRKNAEYFRKKHDIAGVENLEAWKVSRYFNSADSLEYFDVLSFNKNEFKDKAVLDFGCGSGKDGEMFLLFGAHVTFCDITDESMYWVQDLLDRKDLCNNAKLVKIVQKESLPFSDNSFDIINCHGVLHHISYYKETIEEFYRILRPGGKIYLMLYSEFLFERHKDEVMRIQSQQPDKTIERIFGKITDNCPYSTYFTEERIRKEFDKFDIKIIKLYHKNYFRIVVLEK